jgi:gliding motility-associated-like protein
MTPTVQNGPISRYLWTPSTNLSCANCPSTVATIQSSNSYTLTVTNNAGCSSADTINLKVACDKSNVFIPDAFTPDRDGINDVFMIRAAGDVRIKYLRIFNRWGALVFEKNNFLPNNPSDGWDGRVKGGTQKDAVISDVYVYTAEVVCESGSSFIYKGNVSILK